ncbi:MAG TPA: hypothetical protein VN446_06830 [Candidatus Acidoferrum sp.]|nr:hypothetical protein [Candidatus Acidoferrum sp.]
MAEKTPTAPQDREALKAELLAELKAELAAAAPVKTSKSATSAKSDPSLEEYVTVQLFKDGGRYCDDVYVAVNGENCVIRRGAPVQIKRKFALVLDASQEQDTRAAEYAAEKAREFDSQAKLYNL